MQQAIIEANRKRADRCIQACSEANRSDLERILQQRRNHLTKETSNATWAQSLRRADAYANGRRLADLSVDDWSDFLRVMHETYAPATVYTMVAFVKATLAALMGLDEAPKRIRKVLCVREPSRRPEGRVITQDQFQALLEAAAGLERHGYHDLQRLELVTILHVLRDSGFRANELLSLRLGSVELSGQAAYLRLPSNAPLLKTGPREIAVAQCLPAIKAWMAAHPAAGNDQAPLFPKMRSRTGQETMTYQYLHVILGVLGDASGINASGDRGKRLSSHDFRHTRATEAAKNNWHPTKMEAYFGWSPGSKMAARYAHLARSDLRDQVLADAGISDLGLRKTVHPRLDEGQLIEALRELVFGANSRAANDSSRV